MSPNWTRMSLKGPKCAALLEYCVGQLMSSPPNKKKHGKEVGTEMWRSGLGVKGAKTCEKVSLEKKT